MSVRRRWAINGRFLTQKVTGVQRYGREILNALDIHLMEGTSPLTQDLVIDVLVPRSAETVPRYNRIKVRKIGRFDGHLWEQLDLPLNSRGAILSLCNSGVVLKRKQIVCVHDVNVVTQPESYSRAFRLLYTRVIPQVVRNAAAIATVSHHSSQKLEQQGWVANESVAIIPNGHEHVREWSTPAGGDGSAVDCDTIVLIGSPAPHKNMRIVLEVAPKLAEFGLKVAIVGELDSRVFRRPGHAHSGTNIIWCGRVSDGELMQFYSNCLCLAFPSRAEGFGLPPLEAMALGCPVVASNCASMPEVCGAAALYASPDDPEAWLEAFIRLRRDPGLRQRLIERGRARANAFTWRRSAELYLSLMARVDGIEAKSNSSTTAKPGRVSRGEAGRAEPMHQVIEA
jgi:glycosyltransferase involved in cell wall biosynthesis